MTDPVSTFVEVVAGVLVDREGRVLLAARPAGKAFAGRWEFPGGKVDAGETPERALVRELAEELGVAARVEDCRRLLTVTHCYPGATRGVRIAAYRVHAFGGVARGQEGQALAWTYSRDLPEIDILEADRPIVTALRLGDSLDLAHLPKDAAVHAGLAAFSPAPTPRQMAGVILDSATDAAAARRAGADFLLLVGAPSADAIAQLALTGLPWFVRWPEAEANANGTWRGDY